MFTVQAFAVLCAVVLPTTLAAEVPKQDDFAFEVPAAAGGSYYFRKDNQSPELAGDFCRGRGMYLLEIPNLEANNEIQQAIINNGLATTNFWTAGNRLADGQAWEWPRIGKPFEFFNWGKGSPSPKGSNKDCLSVVIEGGKLTWYDVDCKKQQYYICQTTV